MILGFIILFLAIGISAIAGYFSIVGLMALFAATAIPVAIMGSALEIAKVVAAAWLHKNWADAPGLLKTYLVTAVVVLMVITSIGIYGFLSKGHLDQQAPIGGYSAQIERNNVSIQAFETQLNNMQAQLGQASALDVGQNEAQVEAYKQRVQAQIDEVNLKIAPIDIRINGQREIIRRLEGEIAVLDQAIVAYNDVGAVTKGREALADQQEQRSVINEKISDATETIIELETSKSDINAEISALRQQMFNPPEIKVETNTSSVEIKMAEIRSNIDALEDDNLEIQLKINETAAKLGPIEYVADLFAIEDTEKAVQILIVLIMFVFDPIAISLVIAGQWTLTNNSKRKESKKNFDTSITPIVETVPVPTPVAVDEHIEIEEVKEIIAEEQEIPVVEETIIEPVEPQTSKYVKKLSKDPKKTWLDKNV